MYILIYIKFYKFINYNLYYITFLKIIFLSKKEVEGHFNE